MWCREIWFLELGWRIRETWFPQLDFPAFIQEISFFQSRYVDDKQLQTEKVTAEWENRSFESDVSSYLKWLNPSASSSTASFTSTVKICNPSSRKKGEMRLLTFYMYMWMYRNQVTVVNATWFLWLTWLLKGKFWYF